MIKLKSKKEETDNSDSQNINELLSSGEDGNNILKFTDIQSVYSKDRKNLKNKRKMEHFISMVETNLVFFAISMAYLFLVASFVPTPFSVSYPIICLLVSVVLMPCISSFHKLYKKKILQKTIGDRQYKVVDIKDVLKNIFYEKEKSVELIDERILQYVLDKLDKKNLNYKDFLELNLDKEYDKLKDKYIELKNKKDDLSFLKGIYD